MTRATIDDPMTSDIDTPALSSVPSTAAKQRPVAKLVIELTPVLAFFTVLAIFGLKPATAVLIIGSLLALAASRLVLGKISPMLIVTAVFSVVFGGLTLWLDDPRFIKMKPTAVYLLFSAALTFGLLSGRPILKVMLGEALHLTDAGWQMFTARWLGFFVGMAMLNEFVWRNFSTVAWGSFKSIGGFLLPVLFLALQTGFIRRHSAKPPASETSG